MTSAFSWRSTRRTASASLPARPPLGDELPGLLFHLVELANAGQHQMGAGGIAVLALVKVPPAVRPATHFDDGAGSEQVIVDVQGIGIEIAAIRVLFQEGIDAGRADGRGKNRRR